MKTQYAYISNTSNTVVKRGSGRLFSISGLFTAGSLVRIDDTHSFAAGTLNLNATSSNTIGKYGAYTMFEGLGFNTGLVVAVSSNADVTIEYE